MAIMDAEPIESPIGTAIASGAILTALLDKLVTEVLSHDDIGGVLQTAMALISGYSDSAAHDSARLIILRLHKDRGGHLATI